MTPLAPHVSAFFLERLPREKGAPRTTIATYQQAFLLLLKFAANRHGCQPCELSVEQLDAATISAFLKHLENERKNSARTRNVRLAAIKSFMHFLEYRLPAAMEQIRQVLAIPTKRTDEPLVGYLDRTEANALLEAPDLTTRLGVRDRAMLVIAEDLGLRVSEIVTLKMTDVELGSKKEMTVHGKGRRQRCLPLGARGIKALREWIGARGSCTAAEVFVTRRGEQMTTRNLQHIVAKYARRAAGKQPSLEAKHVSPHVLRHTCAMNVLNATHDLRSVALWLGHASIRTTEVYTRADPAQKLEVINSIVPPTLRRGTFKQADSLIATLQSALRAAP